MSWAPLLRDAEAARALRLAARLCAELDGVESFASRGVPEPVARALVPDGLPGLALANAYVALATGDEGRAERAQAQLAAALEEIPALANALGLGRGLCGLGWTVAHLARLGLVDEVDDVHGAIDEVLEAALARPSDLHFDHMFGLAGWLVYLRERATAPLLQRVAARLAAMSDPASPAGRAWRVPPDPRWTGASKIARAPEGHHDVGVAHGVTGALAALAQAGGEAGTVAAATRWLWAQARGADVAGERFPLIVGEPAKSTGWCAGDLGIAAVTAAAGIEPGRALDLAAAAAERGPELRLGLGLCHGLAGRAQCLLRLHALSGDARLADAARRELTLLMDQMEAAPAGTVEPGMFEGLAGVALVLLAAATPVDPGWDRFMLLSG